MANEHILVVDDEEDILELVQYNLEKEGFRVSTVGSGEEALLVARRENPNLIVLDLMLPGLSGLDVCKLLKSDDPTRQIPIIMLTAKGEDADIVTGLELGADDYITKPFSPRVLVARIRASLRRISEKAPEKVGIIIVGDLEMNVDAFRVTMKGHELTLTASEFHILHFLMSHRGWVFSRSQIINAVKGDDYPVTDRSVDVQIVGLRKKLGDAGSYIETVRGIGYRFKD